MYILVSDTSGGVYAVNGRDGDKVVQIFVDKDDAERYNMLLESSDYTEETSVVEIDEEVVVQIVPLMVTIIVSLNPICLLFLQNDHI